MQMIRRSIVVLAALAVLAAGRRAEAQDPVKLPEVVVKGDGTRSLVGVVKDTSGFLLEGADISIGSIHRRVTSRADGSFRFDDIPKGKFDVRARKLGYAPQILRIKIGNESGRMDDFELVPVARALPAVVTSAGRLGLSGVVADTAFASLFGAQVKVLGDGMHTITDSAGAFYLPVKPGKYMVAVTKEAFKDRLLSVTIPSDSGRRVTVSLQPSSGPVSKLEAWNVADLAGRLAWITPTHRALYTREQLQQMGIEWAYDAIVGGATAVGMAGPVPSPDCYALVDGGPTMTKIAALTSEELESIEVYPSSGRSSIGIGKPMSVKSLGGVNIGRIGVSNSRPTPPMSEGHIMNKLSAANLGMNCPVIYVWSR